MSRNEIFYNFYDEMHEVTVKVVRQLPNDKLEYKPFESMKSARDLLFHMFSQEKVTNKGCMTGNIELNDFKLVWDDLKNINIVEDLATYGEQVHIATMKWVRTCSDEEYDRTISAFFGDKKPFQLHLHTMEHFIHHRGQFYIYLRTLGIEPLFVFSGNPP